MNNEAEKLMKDIEAVCRNFPRVKICGEMCRVVGIEPASRKLIFQKKDYSIFTAIHYEIEEIEVNYAQSGRK
jgi:hypothetical protein